MDLHLTAEQIALRDEARVWLRSNVAPEAESLAYAEEEDPPALRAFNKKLAAKGWIAPSWPREYGGMALGPVEQLVFSEAFAYARAPGGARGPAVGYAGPTIMMYGTDEQKGRHLPAITNWDAVWCQGFSEPGSGSDLASLQTTAIRDGDDWILEGTKIWTSHGHYSDWMYLLARTDQEAPKHKGISYFLLDLHSPGVSFHPLLNLAGKKGFGQFFFDNVRMPADALLGEENRGWYIATTTLDLERSNIANTGGARRAIADLAEHLRGDARAATRHRATLAQLAIEVEVATMLSYRVASMLAAGLVPNQEASGLKLFLSELDQRIATAGLAMLGTAGQLLPGSPWAPLRGQFAVTVQTSVCRTIAGGTSEIQRGIMATRGLGLARG
ncbi:MAG: acyl-CoA dehydrogenase family protein [Dehalococcoidia bacterium]